MSSWGHRGPNPNGQITCCPSTRVRGSSIFDCFSYSWCGIYQIRCGRSSSARSSLCGDFFSNLETVMHATPNLEAQFFSAFGTLNFVSLVVEGSNQGDVICRSLSLPSLQRVPTTCLGIRCLRTTVCDISLKCRPEGIEDSASKNIYCFKESSTTSLRPSTPRF